MKRLGLFTGRIIAGLLLFAISLTVPTISMADDWEHVLTTDGHNNITFGTIVNTGTAIRDGAELRIIRHAPSGEKEVVNCKDMDVYYSDPTTRLIPTSIQCYEYIRVDNTSQIVPGTDGGLAGHMKLYVSNGIYKIYYKGDPNLTSSPFYFDKMEWFVNR